jgi:dTDP-4-amino-4,6-dideoxygalactose transaminase
MNAEPKIPWYVPSFDDADIEAVRQTVVEGFVNEGPENRRLEAELQAFFDVPFAITMPSCTTSIALALKALGIGHGDTVLVPAVTFIGTASAVRLAGAEPILVDVDPVTFNMDPEDSARRVQGNTRAIVPVHLNGRPAALPALREIALQHHLVIVEDTAEGLGSRSSEGWLGTLSDAGCFSLAPTKIITSGQGGFVFTRNEQTRDNLVRLRDHGRLSRSSDVHPVTGFNFKVTDMQAALARSQFRKLPARMIRAREIDRMYLDGLRDIPEIVFTPRPEHGGYLMWPDFKSKDRDALVAALSAQGITLRPFWPALHKQPAYASPSAYPGADEASREGCWLPCSPSITDEELNRVIDAIRRFFGGNR